MKFLCDFLFYILVLLILVRTDEDKNFDEKEPTLCEVCRFLVTELKERLDETGKSREVLHTGQGLEKKKKKINYHTSELRLIEALEQPHVCDRILDYNVHNEYKGSGRFRKGMSETMQTLHGLVDKGVKVDLGMPYEMWDKPPAEVSLMQRKCFHLVEEYQDDIEAWYFHNQDANLMEYFCRDRVLKNSDKTCLTENLQTKKDEYTEEKSKNFKGDTGTKGTKNKKNINEEL